MVETENIKKNWKPGWFPIEKVADRMVEPKHPAYGSQETSRRSAATLSQLQSWRNFSKPFPFVSSIWMSTFLITPYLENFLETALFLNCNTFSNPSIFSIRNSHNFCLIWFCNTIQPALITGLQYLGKSLLTEKDKTGSKFNITPQFFEYTEYRSLKANLVICYICCWPFHSPGNDTLPSKQLQWLWRYMMIMSESTN